MRASILTSTLIFANLATASAQDPEHDNPVDLPRNPPIQAAEPAAAVHRGFAALVKQVTPSVVTIRAYVRIAPTDTTTPVADATAPVSGWLAGPEAMALTSNPALRVPPGGRLE